VGPPRAGVAELGDALDLGSSGTGNRALDVEL